MTHMTNQTTWPFDRKVTGRIASATRSLDMDYAYGVAVRGDWTAICNREPSAWESVPSEPIPSFDLRDWVSVSDRERPLVTGVIGTLIRSYGQFGSSSGLTWCFAGLAGFCSGYFKVSGIGTPIRSKAWRWALVGSVSIGTVAVAPANRTWLRGRVARWSSRPRKLR